MDLVGWSRPTVLKALRRLSDDGLITREGAGWRDPHARWVLVQPQATGSDCELASEPARRAPDLLDRIDAALQIKRLDPALFERCACALLEKDFPGLSPVTGGSDFGRDADIPTPGTPLRVVITTAKDVARNLRTSLSQMRRKGLSIEGVVVITSQPLSAQARRTLEETAANYGARVVAVYDRTWLANALYRDPDWRKRLTGVTGEPSTLVHRPLDLADRTWGMLDLVGRQRELADLLDSDGDAILVGVPGSGKTRLLAELDGAMFVARHDPARLADDIRAFAPRIVVVDDAHLRDDSLVRDLRLIRHDEHREFRIVLTGWLGSVEQLERALPVARVVTLGDLEREQVAELLRQMGITRHVLVREILEQAEGRPGWAVTLAELAEKGEAASVIRGAALLRHAEYYLRQTGSGDDQLDLLARVAALDGLPETDLTRMARHLDCAEHQVTGWLQHSTTNGVCELAGGIWVVRPERLREALVGRWFFDVPRRATFANLPRDWPEWELPLLRSAVAAALLGADQAQAFADGRVPAFARRLDEPLAGGARDVARLLQDYARTSEAAARFVIAEVVRAIAGKDLNDVPGGSSWAELLERGTLLRTWEAAANILWAVADAHRLPEALDALLMMAARDERPRNAHPSHAFRLLGDLVHRWLPEGGTVFADREAVLEAVIRLLEPGSSDAQADVAAEVAGIVFDPTSSATWSDPVKFDVVVFSRWIERPTHLRHIAEELWSKWSPLLDRLSDRGATAILDAISAWFRIDAEVPDEVRELARDHGRRMLLNVRDRAARSLGLAVRWNQLASAAQLPDRIEIDPRFAALVADPWGRHRETESQADHLERVRIIAADFAEAGPDAALGELLNWQQQAELLHAGGGLWLLWQELAHAVEDPTAWAVRALEPGLPVDPSALIHMFGEALARDPQCVMQWLHPAMAKHACRVAVIAAVLERDAPADAIDYVIARLGEHDTPLIESAIWRRPRADRTVHALLTHPPPAIRGQAALSVKIAARDGGLVLPTEWHALWSEAFLEVVPDHRDSGQGYELGEILGELAVSEPDLATAWFARHLKNPYTYTFKLVTRIADLPRIHRRSLLQKPDLRSRRHSLVEAALAHDPSWASELLDSGAISLDEALTTIKSDRRGGYFETLGPLLLERGATAVDIASRLVFHDPHWGEESDHYALLVEYCGTLVGHDDPRLSEIGRVGVELFEPQRQRVLKAEHRERVRGWPDP